MPVLLKTADEPRTSTTTMANDGKLVAALDASSTYFFDCMALFTAGATPDIKAALAYSGTLTQALFLLQIREAVDAYGSGGTPSTRPIFNTEAQLTSSPTGLALGGSDTEGTLGGYHWRGIALTNGAGDLSLQWAQNNSNATPATVLAGSYLKYAKTNTMPGTFVVKTSAQSKVSDTTIAADSDLVFATVSGGKYLCEMISQMDCASSTPGIKQELACANVLQSVGDILQLKQATDGAHPGSTQGRMHNKFTEAFLTTPTQDAEAAISSLANRKYVFWSMLMDAVASQFEYRWAQLVSDATSQNSNPPSFIWYRQL